LNISKLNSDRVDILVHTYNHEKTIAKCINSIMSQTHDQTFLTVIDDCSTDNTWNIVCDLQEKFSKKIIAKKTTKNYGRAYLAREECKFSPLGGFWGMMDGDDWWIATDKIELQIEKLNQNKMCAGCSGTTLMRAPNGEIIGHIRPSRDEWNYLDFILGVDNLYVHVSSILWKNIFHGPDGFRPKLAQKNWPRGEWSLTLSALAESKLSICHLNRNVSIYNFDGAGMWSKLTGEQRDKKNKELAEELENCIPTIYKLTRFARKRNMKFLLNLLGIEKS